MDGLIDVKIEVVSSDCELLKLVDVCSETLDDELEYELVSLVDE